MIPNLIKLPLLLAILALAPAACGPSATSDRDRQQRVEIDLADTTFQQIQSLRFARQADSLLPYLSSPDASYRYLAALAYGSLPDRLPLDSLAALLDDPVDEVRAATAFALGQSRRPEAEGYLLKAFAGYDTLGEYAGANRAILEAIGKCGSESSLQAMSTISTYTARDTALLEGQAWGLYRFGLRNMTDSAGTARMLDLVTSSEMPQPVRLIAANYLYRSRNVNIAEDRLSELARTAIGDDDPRIRMTLAIALAKTGTELAFETLENAYRLDPDYRVSCNVISSLANFDYERGRALAFEALEHPNLHVAERAATFFLDHGTARDGFTYYSRGRGDLPWQVHTPLFAAVLRHLPDQYRDVRNSATSRLRRKLTAGDASPFEQIAALRALAEDPWNFEFIGTVGFSADLAIVRAGAVQGLRGIHENPKASSSAFTRFLAPYLRRAIEGGEQDMMQEAAEILADDTRDYASYYRDLDWLEAAYRQTSVRTRPALRLALARALDALDGGDRATSVVPPPSPTIDWPRLLAAGPRPRVQMQTDVGDIELELFTLETPGTVSSFLALIEDRFYSDTYFYRVVPNFVAQGALPLDGHTEEFVLSSELSPRHFLQEGRFGMASRGRHTEWTQFFITHAPTPHLDGNYTLFGQVVEGMDILHQIERGTRIRAIRLEPVATQN